jgi:hypothetical protein
MCVVWGSVVWWEGVRGGMFRKGCREGTMVGPMGKEEGQDMEAEENGSHTYFIKF